MGEQKKQDNQVSWDAIKAAIGTLGAEEIANFIAHGGNFAATGAVEAAIFGGAIAAIAGWNAPPIIHYLRGALPQPYEEKLDPFQLLTRGEPGKRSLWQKLWDIYPDGDETVQDKTVQVEAKVETETEQPSSSIPGKFTIGGQTLAAIKDINQNRIVYFGKSSIREITLHIDSMYHVFDVASSGRGKSNRARTIMMQVVGMAQTYYINPLANNIKAVKDDRKIEVWKPIYDRLANKKPVKTEADIQRLLQALVDEIQARNDMEEQGDLSWRDDTTFVFIDELPEVYARCKEAPGLLDRILRTGRQFNVFCWVFSQTAQVKDIGLSTSAQAQFMTRIYGGGDQTSANRVMKGGVNSEQEKSLHSNGAGLTLMCAEGMSASDFSRAPLLTNEALFAYFGLPPFNLDEWLKPKGDQSARRSRNLLENDFSFSSERPMSSAFLAHRETMRLSEYECERAMKEPLERDEKHENCNERDETFMPSHEDEITVLMAVLQLQNEGVNVTREAIKQRLGWNNAKHSVVKFVCDKHKIAVR